MTWEYERLSEIFAKYRKDISNYDTENTTKMALGKVGLAGRAALFDVLEEVATSKTVNKLPLTFEKLEQLFGFVLDETETPRGRISFSTVKGRA